jgi:predicted ribosome quality control (RQC) complex YloA/Tae2 family protein
VKDQASAHAILFRPKGAKIPDETLRKASQWLIKMSLGSKYKNHLGEKFEILSTECRFVSPIKGDRLGRVTYRNEKVFVVKFDD